MFLTPSQILNSNMDESLDHKCKFNLKLGESWSTIADSNERLSIARFEKWEFNRQRVLTEIYMEKGENGEMECKVKAHGCVVDLQKDLKIQVVDDLQNPCLTEHMENVINFVDNSRFCEGLKLLEGEIIVAMLPHHSGLMKDLTQPADHREEIRAFSDNCLLFATAGDHCSSCSYLLKIHNQRKKRKLAQSETEIHPNCNRRFLSQSEIEQQLRAERRQKKRALEREKYWREKFLDDTIELESEDHDDLSNIFKGVRADNVPEDMECLWDQQKKIINTASPNGYRWHPK